MPTQDTPVIKSPPKLLDQVRDKLQVKHYSIRTESVYADWIKRFILFHGKQPLKAKVGTPGGLSTGRWQYGVNPPDTSAAALLPARPA
ncbi:MAG TPA: hypothetical protein DCQ77_09075 [Betaproteobacteria bacterium]|nr:hypothetical protein [Betaproteobacteria bacterium]